MTSWIKQTLPWSLAVLAIGAISPAMVSAVDPPALRSTWYPPGHDHQHRYRHAALVITHVSHGSPAARAGLQRGDLIVEVDGRDVDTPEELHRALHRTGHRGTLTVRDVRTGRRMQIPVYPAGGHIGIQVQPARY